MKKRQLVRITKKAKPENRTAFRLRFMSCEHCLLCCGIGKEGTLFPPFLLFLFLLFLLGLHFLQNLFQRLDRFRFLTLEPLEIDVLYKLRKRGFPRFLLVVVYLSELVRVQSQLTGYVKLYITRVMETYKLCKVQVTNLNQILKYLYF